MISLKLEYLNKS